MRKIEIKVYKFEELSEGAQEVARRNYAKNIEITPWREPIFEDFKNIGKCIGYNVSDFTRMSDDLWLAKGTVTFTPSMLEDLRSYAPNDVLLYGIAEELFRIQAQMKFVAGRFVSGRIAKVSETKWEFQIIPEGSITGADEAKFREKMKEEKELFDLFLECFENLNNWLNNQLSQEYRRLLSYENLVEELEPFEFYETGDRYE